MIFPGFAIKCISQGIKERHKEAEIGVLLSVVQAVVPVNQLHQQNKINNKFFG